MLKRFILHFVLDKDDREGKRMFNLNGLIISEFMVEYLVSKRQRVAVSFNLFIIRG